MVCCLPPMNPGLGTPGSIHGSWCVFLTLGPMFLAPARVPVSRRGTGWTPGARCGTMVGSPGEREPRRWTRNRGSGGGGGFGSRRTEDLGRASKSSATGGVAGSQDLRVPWSHGPGVSGFAPGRWGGIEGYSNGPLPKKERRSATSATSDQPASSGPLGTSDVIVTSGLDVGPPSGPGSTGPEGVFGPQYGCHVRCH
jgi:hypothetical protein